MSNAGYQVGTYGVLTLSNLLIAILIGRFLGPESLGEFSYVITIMLFSSIFADLGIGLLLIRRGARCREQKHKILELTQNGLALTISLGILLIVLSQLLSFGDILPSTVIKFQIVVIGVAITASTNVLRGMFYAHEKMQYETYYVAFQELTYLALVALVLFFTFPFISIFVAYSFSRIIGLIIALLTYRNKIGKLRIAFDSSVSRSLIQEALPFAVNSGLSIVYIRSSIIALGWLSGNFSVGLYEVGISITMRLNAIAILATNAILPTLSRDYQYDVQSFQSKQALIARYLLIISFPIVIVFFTFADRIIGLLYGNRFLNAVPIFMALAVLIPLRFVTNVIASGLTASDAQELRTLAVFIVAICNVGLNIWLIPIYDYWGAVYSTVITELSLFSLVLFFMKRKTGVKIFIFHLKSLISPYFVIILLAGSTYWISSDFITISINLSAYWIIVWLFVLTPLERVWIGHRLRLDGYGFMRHEI